MICCAALSALQTASSSSSLGLSCFLPLILDYRIDIFSLSLVKTITVVTSSNFKCVCVCKREGVLQNMCVHAKWFPIKWLLVCLLFFSFCLCLQGVRCLIIYILFSFLQPLVLHSGSRGAAGDPRCHKFRS